MNTFMFRTACAACAVAVTLIVATGFNCTATAGSVVDAGTIQVSTLGHKFYPETAAGPP